MISALLVRIAMKAAEKAAKEAAASGGGTTTAAVAAAPALGKGAGGAGGAPKMAIKIGATLSNAASVRAGAAKLEEDKARVRADAARAAARERGRVTPGILVCAPSNTAVNEIVQRLRSPDGGGGLVDAKGARWRPNVVRVGRGGAGSVDKERQDKSGGAAEVARDRDDRALEGGGENSLLDPLVAEVRDAVAHQDRALYPRSVTADSRGRVAEVMLDEVVERRMREHRAAARSQTAGASSIGAALPRDQMRTAVLAEADIVCATLSGAGSPAVLEAARSGALRFAALVIDEAAQVCGFRCVWLVLASRCATRADRRDPEM